jgi:hypothetical protein
MRLFFLLFISVLAACTEAPPYSTDQLQQWTETKAALGPTFAGSPAWQAHMDFVEAGLAEAGVVAVEKLPAPYTRWWAPDNPTATERALNIGGESLPVASYWAYSGSTPPEGISASLLLYRKDMPRDALRGRIIVFQVEPVPERMAASFSIGNEYATGDFAGPKGIADDQWYQGNYVTRFGRFDEVLKGSGAAGAIVVFAMSAERLAGLYTFPLLNQGVVGVPGVYVDAGTGKTVLAAAEQGATATLTLVAHTEAVAPYFYTAVLPGRDYGTAQDEEVLLVTHSDGPNLTQENGTLGILALVRAFAQRPQAERPRSLRVLFDPQHYSPGRHVTDWYALHPEIMQRVVAVLGVEQIGQLEYGDADGQEPGGDTYGLTGRPEPWLIYARNDPAMIAAAIAAIQTTGVSRTELRIPEKKGQGRWTGLGEVALKRDLAGFATLSNMSGYWGTTAGIESFDAELATRQVDTLVLLLQELIGE